MEHISQQDAEASLRDQIARLRAESEAKAVVFKEERRLGDKSVLSSQWLSTVVWHPNAAQQPPFENLALQWFEILPEEIEDDLPDNNYDMRRLTQAVIQMRQDIDVQADAHRSQIQAQAQTHQNHLKQQQERHDEWKASVQANLRQMEDDQKRTEQNAKAKVEELSSRIEVQQMTIKQLETTRAQWRTHYQNQSEKLHDLEEALKVLQANHAEQQAKLNLLQEKYQKVQTQNRGLRQKLEQSESEREALAANYYNIQTKYSAAIQDNRRLAAYRDSQKDRGQQLDKLQSEIAAAKEEIAELKADLEYAEGSKSKLRDSMKDLEQEVSHQKIRADYYKKQATSPRKECPNSFETRQTHRRSSSRTRTPSEAPSAQTASTRHSRTSSATYVDDNASDKEYYDSRRTSRRSSRTRSSKGGITETWGSPGQRQLVIG